MKTQVSVLLATAVLNLMSAYASRCNPSALSSCTSSQSVPTMESEYDLKSSSWAWERMGGASNKAPLMKELQNFPEDLQVDIGEALGWFSKSYKAARRLTKCNLINKWASKAQSALSFRRIGDLNISCAVSLTESDSDAVRVSRIFRAAAEAMRRAGEKYSRTRGWEDTNAMSRWLYESRAPTQSCSLERATGTRFRDNWYLQGAVTRYPVHAQVGTAQRAIIEEFVSANECCPIVVWFRPLGADGKLGNPPVPFTTTFMNWEGGVDLSSFYKQGYTENEALGSALNANALAVELATDAMRPANVAILVVPLALSLIPLALVADVNACAALAYVVFTDILAAVPLVIKGVELLLTGTKVQTKAVTYVVGNDTLAVIEAWTASCRPQERFRDFGLVFIVFGMSSIAVGLALELYARRFMSRKRMQGEDPRPFGSPLLGGVTTRGLDMNHLAPNFQADLPAVPPRRLDLIGSRLMRRRTQESSREATAVVHLDEDGERIR